MQQQNIEFNIEGIKCDNPTCDYKDMSVDYTDYPNWVNKPCPKCGENLLTEADYKLVKDFIDVAELINAMQLPKDDKVVTARINMDGTGTWTYDITGVEDNK